MSNLQPITSERFMALSKEEKELFKKVWEFQLRTSTGWQIEANPIHKEFAEYSNYMYDNYDAATRQMYYPLPVETQQPEPVNAPLINEGGETVDALENLIKQYRINADPETEREKIYCDKWGYGARAGYQHRDAEVTTLQTALAEAQKENEKLKGALKHIQDMADGYMNELAVEVDSYINTILPPFTNTEQETF